MTSTISESAARHAMLEGRRRLRRAELRKADPGQTQAGDVRLTMPDKLRVPQPSLPLLHRPRVSALLQQGAAHRVTMVCAPSGAGKTIACALWAATAPVAGKVAWISLDPGDRSPGQFWSQVRSALTSVPALPDGLAEALRTAGDDVLGDRLAEMPDKLSGSLTLVLDDITHLAGSAALGGLDDLVRHGPRNLRLVLSGRHAAGLPIARLRVAGELAEIGAAELACTPEEADRYFELLGYRLPVAQRDDLLWHTQGWMTGLRLAAMRAEQGRPGTPVARIAGDDPAVADYLWDEILADLPAGRRLFLLRTSVVDVLCGDLADTLTGGTGGTAILARMCRENMMVQPAAEPAGSAAAALTSADRFEYRYHPLLLDLLRAQLRRELPAEVTPLTRRAARWHAGHGLHAAALRDAARAGDWDFAARVLAEAGPAMLLPGPAAELEPILTMFPASRYAGDASVAGALAAAGLRTGDCCAAALHLRNASQALHRCPPAQRRLITPWLQALELMSAGPSGASTPDAQAAATELIGKSRDIAVDAESVPCGRAEHTGLGLLWCELGIAALVSMNVADARDCFDKARRHLAECRYAELADRARAWQAVAEGFYGDLLGACELIADQPPHGGAVDPLSARLAELASALVHCARDELAGARKALDGSEADDATGRPASGAPGRPARHAVESAAGRLVSALAAITRARLSLCEGDQGTARTLLTRLRYQYLNAGNGLHQGKNQQAACSLGNATGTAILGSQGGVLDSVLAPLDAEIALRDGDLSRARHALSRLSQVSPAGHPRVRADLLLATARVQLAQGDSAGALRSAVACLDGTAGQVTLHDHVCALVAAAIAYRRLGQAEQAAEQLTCAMAIAEPHGMFRPFLDGGTAARSVLTALVRPASQSAAFAARILQRFDALPAWQAGPSGPPSAPLTSSELAVLRLLPSHMTNQEIAEALFLSINTVKTHLRSVYRKLGVTTRRQAISRSGKLGLL